MSSCPDRSNGYTSRQNYLWVVSTFFRGPLCVELLIPINETHLGLAVRRHLSAQWVFGVKRLFSTGEIPCRTIYTSSLPRNCERSVTGWHRMSMTRSTEFSKRVFSKGALPSKIKQLIAVAVAHVTQCPYCIQVLLDQSVGRYHGIQLGVMGSSLSSQTIRQPVRVR